MKNVRCRIFHFKHHLKVITSERQIHLSPMKNLLDQPSKVEDREERFGDIAQKKGYITWPQLLEALELQIEETVEGRVQFIGEILCDLQFITKLELRNVLESMDNGTAENG